MTAEPLIAREGEPEELVELMIPMPADMMAALKVAAFQRRSLGEPDVPLTHLVREAISAWLEQEMENTTSVVIKT